MFTGVCVCVSGGSRSLACLGVFLRDSKIQACNLLFPICFFFFLINNFAADSQGYSSKIILCVMLS